MSGKPLVMKFGGTSVEDTCAFQRVARIVAARSDALPVVVVSAMSRITDALLTSVEMAAGGEPDAAEDSLEYHVARHRRVARAALGTEEADAFESELAAACREIAGLLREAAAHPALRPRLQDEVVSYGERLSAALLSFVLRAHDLRARYVDARRCILTGGEHGRAAPLPAETESRSRAELLPVIEAGEIPVLGGFIGSTLEGRTTTLGRGGSDYTATLLGAALGAREVQIWTDVTGVLTADPAVAAEAQTVPHLSYREAAELASFGLKVLHPKTVTPAAEASIPIRILNSRLPEEPGTYVCSRPVRTPEVVKAVTHRPGVTVLHVGPPRTGVHDGFPRPVFDLLHAYKDCVSVVAISGASVSLALSEPELLPGIVEQLERLGDVKVEPGRALIAAVGEGLQTTPGAAARAFGLLGDVCPFFISQGDAGCNLSFLVAEEKAHGVVKRLHQAFFGDLRSGALDDLFGLGVITSR